jgi:hypothetical protein
LSLESGVVNNLLMGRRRGSAAFAAVYVGHALLTSLFLVLAASYAGLFVWHVWLRAKS